MNRQRLLKTGRSAAVAAFAAMVPLSVALGAEDEVIKAPEAQGAEYPARPDTAAPGNPATDRHAPGQQYGNPQPAPRGAMGPVRSDAAGGDSEAEWKRIMKSLYGRDTP